MSNPVTKVRAIFGSGTVDPGIGIGGAAAARALMSDEPGGPSKNDFDARLRAAQAKRPKRTEGAERSTRGSGLSLAFRIGVELVSALIVGVGIGVLLDRWWGTAPWMLLLFFVLGGAAGILNVYRAMAGYGEAAGYRGPKHQGDQTGRGRRPD